MIPHSRPCLGEEEVEAVTRVVRSGIVAQGPEVQALERELANRWSCSEAVALAHGTAALHLALLGAGARPGRSVLIPSYSCVSLLQAVTYPGAEACLVDCREGSPQMDEEAALARLKPATVAAIVPHLLGGRAEVSRLCRQLPTIEDCTHNFGTFLPLQGVAAAVSFFATKMVAGGEGGALVTDSAPLAESARDRRNYDEKAEFEERFNYKMTDLSASLLRVQLARLDGFLQRRRQLAEFYRDALSDVPGLEIPADESGQTYYRFVVLCPDAERLIASLASHGVAARRPVFQLIHRYVGLPDELFPHAVNWWQRCVSLPLYPALSDQEAETVVAAIRKACR